MDWKALVGSVAPVLGTALGGPLGGIAVKAIAGALGLSEQTEEAVAQALSGASPDDLLKLKQADQQFAKDMKALDIDLERIHAGDRDSARKREAVIGDKTTRNLAYMVVGSFIGVVIAMLFAQVTVESAMAGALVGYLSAKAEQVIAYYFGSSAGSKAKDAALALKR